MNSNQVKIGKTIYQAILDGEEFEGQTSWRLQKVLKSGKLGKETKTLILYNELGHYFLCSGLNRLPKAVNVAWIDADNNLANAFFENVETAYIK